MHERKVKITGGLWESYKKYKKENKNSKIDRKTYVNICHDFNKVISQKIIKESFEFKLPFRLGYLRIKSFKIEPKIVNGKLDKNKLAPDWDTTWKYWHKIYPDKTRKEIKLIANKKLIYHLNEHTDGYTMKWYWDKRFSCFKNQSVYLFKPVKGGIIDDEMYNGRLGLAAWIKSPLRKNEYYE